MKNIDKKIRDLFNGLDINQNTQKDYEIRSSLFIDFLKLKGLNINTFLFYKRFLDGKSNFSVSTKAKYLTVAKVILKELNRLGYLPTDITSTIKDFKQNKKHKKNGISDEEMATMIGTVGKMTSNPNNLRLKAILSLLTFQGLRQIEITRLDVEDIDMTRKTALVLGKGRDDKEITGGVGLKQNENRLMDSAQTDRTFSKVPLGAGEGSRTPVIRLETWSNTVILHPQTEKFYHTHFRSRRRFQITIFFSAYFQKTHYLLAL